MGKISIQPTGQITEQAPHPTHFVISATGSTFKIFSSATNLIASYLHDSLHLTHSLLFNKL